LPTVEIPKALPLSVETKPEVKATPSIPTAIPQVENVRPKTTAPTKTLKLTDLLKTDPKAEEKTAAVEKILNDEFTPAELEKFWREFAEQRRKFQAEFQMLSQPYELRNKEIVVNLLSPVHETMLGNIKVELTTFLRARLRNSSIQVIGQLTTSDDKKVIYTNKDKFEFLADKNPILKEMKDRLGLDTDF
jgi:hypothetical protein